MTGRWIYRGSAAGVLVLAAAAFTLSYDALHQLALDSRVRPALAWLWPVVIDGTIVVALLTCWPPTAPLDGPATHGRWPGCSRPPRSPSTSRMPPSARSPSWSSPWPPSPWSSPPTCSCNRSAGDRRYPTQPHELPNSRPAPKPHSRTGRATSPHLSREARIGAHRLAPVLGFGRPTRPSWRPARPQPAPAWPGPRTSANGMGNAYSSSSPLIRRELGIRTATAGPPAAIAHTAPHNKTP